MEGYTQMDCGGSCMQRRSSGSQRNWLITTCLVLWTVFGITVFAFADEKTETGLNTGAAPIIGEDLTTLTEDFISDEDYSVTAEGDMSGTYSDVAVAAYGIMSEAVTAINVESSGDIDVVATGGVGEDTNAFAMGIGIVNGAVENSGNVTATATGGSASSTGSTDADASGRVYGIVSRSGGIVNSGAMTLSISSGTASSESGDAYADTYYVSPGIWVYGGDVDNSGALSFTATAGNASSQSGGAFSDVGALLGIYNENGTVSNRGDLMISTTAGEASSQNGVASAYIDEVFGILGYSSIENSGGITMTATAGNASSQSSNAGAGASDVTGIFCLASSSTDSVFNSGDLTISVTAGNASSQDGDAYAGNEGIVGIYSYVAVENSGTITLSATGGSASSETGDATADVSALGIVSVSGELANSGTIDITATAGTAVSQGGDASASSLAYGIYALDNATNSGDITITASGSALPSTATDDVCVDAVGILSGNGSTLVNSGDISVTATAENGYSGYAAGILFVDGGTLTNTGAIFSDSDESYQVAAISGTLTLSGAYNMNLDGDPDVGAIYVGDTAILEINDAELTVSTLEDEALLDTQYRIFETEDTATVNGAFSGLGAAANPNVTLTYHDQSTTTAADDAVSISYTPLGSGFSGGVDLLRRNFSLTSSYVTRQVVGGFIGSYSADSGTRRLYADAGTRASDAGVYTGSNSDKNRVFLTPYYTPLDIDLEPVGYEADIKGVVGGYDRFVKGALYGVHIGYSKSDMEFSGIGFDADEEDQEVITFGLHGMGRFMEDYTLRGELSYYSGSHEHTGLTGLDLNLGTRAEYDSNGIGASLAAGRLMKFGNGNLLLPEVGVEYMSVDREGFTTVAEAAAWNVTVDSLSEDQIAGTASVRWLKRTTLLGMKTVPSVSTGVRYLLTGDSLEERQTAGSTATLLETELDDVSGTASASLLIDGEWISAEIAYNGEFASNSEQHSVALRLEYSF